MVAFITTSFRSPRIFVAVALTETGIYLYGIVAKPLGPIRIVAVLCVIDQNDHKKHRSFGGEEKTTAERWRGTRTRCVQFST